MNDEQEKRARRISGDWLDALKCPGARRIMGRVLRSAMFCQSHCPGDAAATAFNEGVRSVGLAWIDEIERAQPGSVKSLISEIMEEIKNA